MNTAGSFITQNLMPGERVIAITRIHPMVLVAPSSAVALGVALGLIGLVGSVAGAGRSPFLFLILVVGTFGAVVAGIGVLVLAIARLTTEYSCTDRRILIKSGLLTTQLREMPLTKVEALLLVQGLFGKMFGYGTLIFKGSGGTRRACNHIEDLFGFYKSVQEQVAVAQKHR